MRRRDFLRTMGFGMAAGSLAWSLPHLWAWAAAPARSGEGLRLALLTDAHLENGNPSGPRAVALTRAVDAVNALTPPADLAVFLGDLAHGGDPYALALGREILRGLKPPLRLLRGEQDADLAWRKLFGKPFFAESWRGIHLLGMDTSWRPARSEPAGFAVGRGQRRWLQEALVNLHPESPVVVLSHAPLYQLYQPWHFWTRDSAAVHELLAPFSRVALVHGHVHQDLRLSQGNLAFRGLPATAWALPDVRQGTPGPQRPLPCPAQPDGGPGCGWTLLSLTPAGHRAAQFPV